MPFDARCAGNFTGASGPHASHRLVCSRVVRSLGCTGACLGSNHRITSSRVPYDNTTRALLVHICLRHTNCDLGYSSHRLAHPSSAAQGKCFRTIVGR